MNGRLRLAGLVLIGAVALTLAMAILRNPVLAMREASANAQEKRRPAERSVRRLVEVGPTRRFTGSDLWGRRTTYSDGRVDYSVRISWGTVLDAEVAADFVTFAKQVEARREDLQARPPAEEVSIRWVGRDVEGKEFELFSSPSDGEWNWNTALPGLVNAIEQALKDIEDIKANKARVPW